MKRIVKEGLSLVQAHSGSEDAICRDLSLAFGFSSQRAREYVGHVGLSSFRVLQTEAGAVKASAALIETAHMFGGSAVRAANIAHVAIAPEARGLGLALPIIEALCQEARGRGALMVSLFASTRPVYRKCGFELAGSEIIYEAETAALPNKSNVAFFPLPVEDPRIRDAYAAKANMEAGLLRRTSAHWEELSRAPRDCLAAYGTGDGVLQAYLVVDASDPDMLEIRDWHAATGEMAAAILCFAGRFRSVYAKVRWHGGPQDALVAAMPDKGWRLVHQEDWMARILDPAAALESRGYLANSASIGIRVVDGDQTTELCLKIDSGRAKVFAGDVDGSPVVTVDANAFSSLFTGFRPASKLAHQGVLSGDAKAVQLCELVFAGLQPWVAEHF